jgi:hypothetical protein
MSLMGQSRRIRDAFSEGIYAYVSLKLWVHQHRLGRFNQCSKGKRGKGRLRRMQSETLKVAAMQWQLDPLVCFSVWLKILIDRCWSFASLRGRPSGLEQGGPA